jgi:hypothetical protein
MYYLLDFKCRTTAHVLSKWSFEFDRLACFALLHCLIAELFGFPQSDQQILSYERKNIFTDDTTFYILSSLRAARTPSQMARTSFRNNASHTV